VDELTQQQKLFCREYIKDFNGTQAAIRAGYSPKTAYAQASRLLRNVKVQQEIKRLADQALKRFDVTVDRIVQEYAYLAFLDINDLYDEQGRILPIKDIPERARRAIIGLKVGSERIVSIDEETVIREFITEYKLADKRKALEDLARYKLMFAGENKFVLQTEPKQFDEEQREWLKRMVKERMGGNAEP
jgi:phage terminase small subunit